MKQTEYNTLGLVIALSVAASVDEYDKLAGRTEACLDDANDNTVYRGCLTDFRKAFCLALEKETGIKRATKPKLHAKTKEPLFTVTKDADGNEVKTEIVEWAERESDYIDSVKGALELSDEAYVSRFFALANTIAQGVKFDPSVREAGTGPKIAKTYLDAADRILAKGGTFAGAAAKLAERLAHPVDATREGVARAIAEQEAIRRRSVADDLAS